jgi:hypothetical protein
MPTLRGLLPGSLHVLAPAVQVTDVEEFVEQFRGDLMPLVLDWSRGATFRSLVSDKRTTIFEVGRQQRLCCCIDQQLVGVGMRCSLPRQQTRQVRVCVIAWTACDQL